MAKRTAYHFFLEHAGGIYRPGVETRLQGRQRAAKALARAEKWAEAQDDLKFVVQDDDERAYCYCDNPECEYHEGSTKEWDTVGVRLVRACPDHPNADCCHAETIESLWGIMDPTPEYLRVIKAELALEAMPE